MAFIDSHTSSRIVAGSYNIKLSIAKVPSTATSVTITGIVAADTLLAVVASKNSGNFLKTTADLTSGATALAGKVSIASAGACTGGELKVLWVDIGG
jgi:hypothetical protein